jgi:hypothetical protein
MPPPGAGAQASSRNPIPRGVPMRSAPSLRRNRWMCSSSALLDAVSPLAANRGSSRTRVTIRPDWRAAT